LNREMHIMDAQYTHRFLRTATYLFFFLMLSNLVFLNIWIYKNNIQNRQNNSIIGNLGMGLKDKCGDDCLAKINEKIYEATSSFKLSESPSAPDTSSQVNIKTSSSVKEFYIPFGYGSNSTDDWADVSGLQAYVDTVKYQNIKNVVFEATIYIPTGNQKAYARLFNVTDKHPVWFSEVSIEGGQQQLVTSEPIKFDPGNKLYQVQMKTSLKRLTNLTQARLHINVE